MTRRIESLEPGFPAAVAAATQRWNSALRVALVGTALGPALAVAGAAALLARGFGASRTQASWCLAVAAVAAIAAGLSRARRRRVDPEQVAVLLDLRAGGDGRWLHAFEGGPQPAAAAPHTAPRPRAGRVLRSLLPALLFAAASLAVPVSALLPEAPLADDPLSAQKLAELQEMSRRLAEAVPLEEEFRAEIEQRLRQLEQGEDDGMQGEALREALDRVEDRLGRRAAEAADALSEALRQSEAAAAAMTAAEAALAEAERSGGDVAAAQREIEEVARLADLALQEALARLEQAGELSALPSNWEGMDLARQLAELGRASAAGLSELTAQGLLDPASAPGAGEDRDAAVLGSGDAAGGELAGVRQGPGQGAPSRGPGTAPLSWGQETPDLAAAMEARALPPPEDLEAAMRLLQVVGSAPRADGAAESVGAAAAGGATGQAAWQRRTAPHHREAVRRFFERKD